jgi:DnaJ-class molecular chaperone
MRCAFCRGAGTVLIGGSIIRPCADCKGSGEAPEGRDTREDRIRALAAQCVFDTAITLERAGHDWETAVDLAVAHSELPRHMATAARITDALDALPVPKAGER